MARRQTAAQRRASMANLRKARAARGGPKRSTRKRSASRRAPSRTAARRAPKRKTGAKRTMPAFNQRKMFNGALAGLASEIGGRFGGRIGAGAATTLAGYLQRDQTIQSLGSYQVGAAVANIGAQAVGMGGSGGNAGVI